MWCKKCWKYLDCALIEIQKGKNSSFGTINEAKKSMMASEEAAGRLKNKKEDDN